MTVKFVCICSDFGENLFLKVENVNDKIPSNYQGKQIWIKTPSFLIPNLIDELPFDHIFKFSDFPEMLLDRLPNPFEKFDYSLYLFSGVGNDKIFVFVNICFNNDEFTVKIPISKNDQKIDIQKLYPIIKNSLGFDIHINQMKVETENLQNLSLDSIIKNMNKKIILICELPKESLIKINKRINIIKKIVNFLTNYINSNLIQESLLTQFESFLELIQKNIKGSATEIGYVCLNQNFLNFKTCNDIPGELFDHINELLQCTPKCHLDYFFLSQIILYRENSLSSSKNIQNLFDETDLILNDPSFPKSNSNHSQSADLNQSFDKTDLKIEKNKKKIIENYNTSSEYLSALLENSDEISYDDTEELNNELERILNEDEKEKEFHILSDDSLDFKMDVPVSKTFNRNNNDDLNPNNKKVDVKLDLRSKTFEIKLDINDLFDDIEFPGPKQPPNLKLRLPKENHVQLKNEKNPEILEDYSKFFFRWPHQDKNNDFNEKKDQSVLNKIIDSKKGTLTSSTNSLCSPKGRILFLENNSKMHLHRNFHQKMKLSKGRSTMSIPEDPHYDMHTNMD